MVFFKTKLFKLTISLVALAFFFSFSILHSAEAAGIPIPDANTDNIGISHTKIGGVSINGSTGCVIAGNCSINGIVGISGGDLTITGASSILKIKPGALLVLGDGSTIVLSPPKGQIIMETGGSLGEGIVHGKVCILDSDNDGYANNGALYQYASTSCPANYKEKAALSSVTEYDCNDNDPAIHDCCTSGYRDYDKDGSGKKDDVQACYTPSASYNIVSNNYDCDDNNASIYHGWSTISFCGVGTCGGSGTDSCSFGTRSNTCTTSAKSCCNAGGTYKAAQTPISTCLKCNGTQADPVNQTSAEDLAGACSTGALGSGTSCRGANCSGSGDSCASLANGTTCNYGAYGAWSASNGACFATRFRPYYTCSSGACSGSSSGSDYDANQNASSNGNVWNGSGSWIAASCSSYCGIQTAYCSGQTLARGVYGCNMSGFCDNVTVRASCPPGGCTGGENNRCSGSACINSCSNGLDDDGDGFIDGQDSDCGGYSQCSSGTCCNTATGQFKTNATICSAGSFSNPASGSCQRVATDQYCTGSSSSCTGSTVNRYDNAPSTNKIWNGSSWVTSTNGANLYCGSSAANSCSGQTVQKDAYGCNTSGSCGTTANGYKLNTGTICGGGENDFCSGGSCQYLCSDGLNNDGDTYTDSLDPDCGAQCTSGACCDTTTNRWRSSSYTCRASAGTCDSAENCTGSSDNCPGDSKFANGTLCRNTAGVCDVTDYCNGVSNTCTDSKSTALYRAASDTCDTADYCDGSSNNAPADAVKSNGTLCRNSNGSGCDYADYCNGSAKTCADSQVANDTICAYGGFGAYSGSGGSCYATASRPYYTCSSGTCSSSIAGYDSTYNYGSDGQVWNGSAWAAASGSNKCGTGSFSCSGNTSIQLQYYGCNGGNSCSTYMGTYQYTTCSGAEDSMCINGNSYCTNACVSPYDSADNNGNGYNDNQDAACAPWYGGCGYCTSGSCCNTGNGCYYSSATVCSSGSYTCYDVCTLRATDTKCSGSSSACNGGTAYRYNYGSSGQVCSGSSFVTGSSSYYCSRTSSPTSCSGNQPLDNAKYCNGGGACSVTGTTLAYDSACSGGTPYCTAGSCYNCSTDAHCPADGFVAGSYGCSGSNVTATWRNYYCSYGCQYSDTGSTVVQNCASTGQICSGGACTYNSCSAQTVSSYSVPALTHNQSTTVTRGVGYRVGGGYFQATATCNNGTVSVTGASGPYCYSGYQYTYGSWYQSTFGYYDVCVISTCSASSISGYSYSAFTHGNTVAASKPITNGTWNATLKCTDGGVNVQSEALTCNSGFISTGSACVQCTTDANCNSGYYCDTASYDYYNWCSPSYNDNACHKKCWNVSETKVAYVNEGDAAKANVLYGVWYSNFNFEYVYNTASIVPLGDNSTVSYCNQSNTGYFDTNTTPLRNCTVVMLDNPICMSKWGSDVSFTTANCPAGINSSVSSVTGQGGQCKQNATMLAGWRGRLRFKCSATVTPLRFFGDACRTYGSQSLNAVVNSSGSCAVPQYCGDWSCNNGEDCSSCSNDCGACEICGDGQCTGYEDQYSCPEDCSGDGSCNYNYSCEEYNGENCRGCSSDCGGCYSCNWNYYCDTYEDYYSCSYDCNYPY